jgi:carbamoyl-phosphate synthase small subunit
MSKKAILVLENGLSFEGVSFGAEGTTFGEVVFNTSMSGYQEILTDPSYHRQIVTMTSPQIGNYGINGEDNESAKPWAAGFIIKELSTVTSNWRATTSLNDYLKKHNIVGIANIDTRELTLELRKHGVVRGAISTEITDTVELIKKVKSQPTMAGSNLAYEVTTDKTYVWQKFDKPKYKVVCVDVGIKHNILRKLTNLGCECTVVPARTSAKDILALNPDGIFVSNGPGDPEVVIETIQALRELIPVKPIFGICLGHQLLALALGGRTYKLKFGHRGGNHPVKNMLTGKIEISAQNHGFAVDADSLPPNVMVTHLNLNDNTNEGLSHKDYPVFSVQYHPESAPGPHDSHYLFEQFIANMGAK